MPRLEERQLLRWFLPTIRDAGEEMDSKRSRQLKMLIRIGGLTHP